MRCCIVLVLSGCDVFEDPLGLVVEPEAAATCAGPNDDPYVVDFVAAAASGADINDLSEVTGTSRLDVGCGPFCLPDEETVVWTADDVRIVLPEIAGKTGVIVRAINAAGVAVGVAGFPSTIEQTAVVWEPAGDTYTVTDLGSLGLNEISEAIGIDETGRVVGWSQTTNIVPPGRPFLWTDTGGMIDLTTLGAPQEKPLAVSPSGMVATADSWYHLDDPATVFDVPAAPAGFAVGTYPTTINDDGEQARFLVSTSAQNLVYLFRLHPDGTWNQISSIGTGSLSTYGIGSIAPDGTVTATLSGHGYIAFGVDGEAEPLADLISCTYGGGDVTMAGPQNDLTGEILAELMIGLEPRVVRLTRAEPCTSDCAGAGKLTLGARFVQDPQHPGQCFAGGDMFNQARATVLIKDDQGDPVGGAEVTGRFMDEYWEDEPVSDITSAAGEAEFFFEGPCGVGTISFMIDDVVAPGLTFDPTRGKGLVVAKIPK